MSIFKFSPKFAALTAASALLLTACVAGESEVKAGAATSAESLTIDFATYNPLSLVIKEKGWLEDELDGVEVTWEVGRASCRERVWECEREVPRIMRARWRPRHRRWQPVCADVATLCSRYEHP